MTIGTGVDVARTSMGLSQLSNTLKTLCEQNRMRILCFLMQGERGVCELADCLSLPQNLVSHHLRVLRDLGLVAANRDEHDCRCMHYSVDRAALARLNALYLGFFAAQRERPWHLACCSEGECCPDCRPAGAC